MADGKKKRRQKLIGKQNPKKKKKIELDNFQFNYFNDKENFLTFYNRSNDSKDMPIDEERTVVEFVENEEVGHIDILKALWNMNRSNMSITIFFTYNFLLLIL